MRCRRTRLCRNYSRAIRLNPKAMFFYYHRGIAEFELGRFGKAKRNLRKALKLANQVDETSLIAKIKKRRKDMKRKK